MTTLSRSFHDVAFHTSDFAFVHLGFNLLPRRAVRGHHRDCADFRIANMVELKEERISFTTLYAWMIEKML